MLEFYLIVIFFYSQQTKNCFTIYIQNDWRGIAWEECKL